MPPSSRARGGLPGGAPTSLTPRTAVVATPAVVRVPTTRSHEAAAAGAGPFHNGICNSQMTASSAAVPQLLQLLAYRCIAVGRYRSVRPVGTCHTHPDADVQ